MEPDNSIRKRAKKVVDAGSVTLAQLQETIDTNDKLESLIENTSPKDVQKIEFVNKDAELAGAFFSLLKGQKGDKGDSPTEEELLTIIKPLISEETRGERGGIGPKGEDGKTPIKGKDYFTKDEIKEFISQVTPQKGVDYFDGIDAKEMIYVGKNPPSNAIKGNLWYKI